jgi:hypothetical protein
MINSKGMPNKSSLKRNLEEMSSLSTDQANQLSVFVVFSWTDSGLSVHSDGGAKIVEATFTLHDDAECRLKPRESGKEEIITPLAV